MTFNIEEGELFTFGESGIRSTVETIDIETLQAAIEHVEGDRYDLRKNRGYRRCVDQTFGEKGFAFSDIRARTRRDRETN